jgi:predicted AlkP superfamily phosphohydrolase/phosphomutase
METGCRGSVRPFTMNDFISMTTWPDRRIERKLMAKDRKVFAFGIDGATFDLISPWCRQGKLPNMSKLLGEAASGILQSTPEPNSAQAWSSFMTGLNPGNHGVYYFLQRKESSYDFEFTNATSRDGKTLWKIAGELGKKCVVINVPLTYPPEEINGIMISGMDAPGTNSGFTYPQNIYDELVQEIGEYVIESDASKFFRNGDYRKTLGALEKTIDNRHKATRHLMEKYPWDLFVVVFTATDRAQHHFWRFMDETHPLYDRNEDEALKSAILSVYQKIDAVVGDIRGRLDDETTFFVMSDHGAGPSSNRTVYINKWLNNIGMLHYKSQEASNLVKRLYFQARSAWLWRVHVVLKRLLPRALKDFFRQHSPTLSNKIRTFGQSLAIDWFTTKAYSTETTPTVRLNVKGKHPCGIVEPGQEYEDVRDFIVAQLRDLKDPYTDEGVVGEIYKREEIYHGSYLEEAPDIVFRWRNGGYTHRFSQSSSGNDPIQILSAKELEFAESVSRPSGVHTPEGVVIVQGKNIKKGWKAKEANIEDLSPTILYTLGLPVPKNMDGHIMFEVFEEEFVKENPPAFVDQSKDGDSEGEVAYCDEDEVTIAERLRGLGYIE